MDKEEILAKNKKDNLFFDEYEQHTKLKGQSFSLLFTIIVCVILFLIKTFSHQNTSDMVVILLAILFSLMVHRAHSEKTRVNLILAGFSFILMLYYFIQFLLAV